MARKIENNTHRSTSLVRHIRHLALINKWRRLASSQLAIPDEKMNVDAALFVFDDLSTSLAFRRRRILALPVKVMLVDPMVQVLVLLCFSLLVQGNQKWLRKTEQVR